MYTDFIIPLDLFIQNSRLYTDSLPTFAMFGCDRKWVTMTTFCGAAEPVRDLNVHIIAALSTHGVAQARVSQARVPAAHAAKLWPQIDRPKVNICMDTRKVNQLSGHRRHGIGSD